MYETLSTKTNGVGYSGARVLRASASEAVDSSLIPSRVKPMTVKIGIHSFPA